MQRRKFGLADQLRVSVAGNTCDITEVRTDGEWVTICLMPSEAQELMMRLEMAVKELKACGNLGGAQAQDVTGGRTFPSLSQEYSDRRHGAFAHCRSCNVTYWDDVPNYGSLLCPRCWEFVLVRGWVVGETGAAVKTDNDDAPSDESKKRLSLSDIVRLCSVDEEVSDE